MEKANYKGKGNHNVNQLESIIEQREEELHKLKTGERYSKLEQQNKEKDELLKRTLPPLHKMYEMYGLIYTSELIDDITKQLKD